MTYRPRRKVTNLDINPGCHLCTNGCKFRGSIMGAEETKERVRERRPLHGCNTNQIHKMRQPLRHE